MVAPIRPAEEDPDLYRALLAKHRRFLEGWHPVVGPRQYDALARQTEQRHLSAVLWRPRGSEARGLALVQDATDGVRVHGVWIEPARPESLSGLLSDLELVGVAPVVAVTDILPSPGADEQATFFRPRGFWHRAKVLMRRPAGELVSPGPCPREIRAVEASDLPQLVRVYARAYSARPGEFWTWSNPNPSAEAEADVMGHLTASGEWAQGFLREASLVWEAEGVVVGGVLVSAGRGEAPYVEDLIVDPTLHRRGIGRSLMERAILEAQRPGARPVELAAIRLGAPYRLYQRLGFVEVPPPRGRLDGHWIRGPDPY